ncbi:serine hydrolase domain-containing protein [Litchfieldia alkalitelluris]|uniref:serine hydrolase domain-containing protein n=1 Tax=Litchfieldia alkalitelluris TaxID=304268 RepID=UPI000996C033|nr:serine hydrolase domain-containing protein [Litchfieldia alkalitelluris]
MELLHRLHPLLNSFVEKGPAGCSLAVMHEGKKVFESHVGYSDLALKNQIAEDTIYRIFSMTKVVTCTAALMLFERGLFLLNDPLEDYLPEFKNMQVYGYDEQGELVVLPAKRSILIKDLFTMTSGLTYSGEGNETERQVMAALKQKEELGENLTVRTLSKTLANIPLAFEPGTKWCYGFSHDVLGALIEVLSGKSLGEFFQVEIFDPLKMKDTFFTIPDNKKHRLATLYDRSDEGELIKNERVDKQFQPSVTFESGGSGLLSTLDDYSRFAYMLANGGEFEGVRIIGEKTIHLMGTNHLQPEHMEQYNWGYLAGYGYGLGVRTLVDPALSGINSNIGEFGWSGLAGTWVLIDPKEKLSAVYMQQMFPNFESYHQPRLRAVIYGAL